MEWKLFDKDGSFLQDVNCEYDSCDMAQWDHGATKLRLDFERKEAYIIEKEATDE